MKCPHCQIDLTREVLAGLAVDRCRVCRGLWLDEWELGTIVASSSPSEPDRSIKPVQTLPVSTAKTGCPKCSVDLQEKHYAHDSGVWVKKCVGCGGVWLESGQLELLMAYQTGTPSVRKLGEAAAAELMISRRMERFRRVTRSKLASGLVAVFIIFLIMSSRATPYRKYRAILGLSLPLACIWFPDKLGRMTGYSLGLLRPQINEPTHADILAVGGWLVLLIPFYVPVIIRLAIWICS